MLFRSFFLEYCINIKNLNLKISWKEQPFYRKLILTLIFIIAMIGIPFVIIKNVNYYYFLFVGCMLLLVGVGWDFTSHGQKELLPIIKKHSSQRMEVLLKLLEKYSISISDKESISLLIEEAKEKKSSNNPFIEVKKSMKIFTLLVVPLITLIVGKFSAKLTIKDSLPLLLVAIFICGIIMMISPFLEDIVYWDKKYYDYLIDDLRQILIFNNKFKEEK